jgi:hypothetical protein
MSLTFKIPIFTAVLDCLTSRHWKLLFSETIVYCQRKSKRGTTQRSFLAPSYSEGSFWNLECTHREQPPWILHDTQREALIGKFVILRYDKFITHRIRETDGEKIKQSFKKKICQIFSGKEIRQTDGAQSSSSRPRLLRGRPCIVFPFV